MWPFWRYIVGKNDTQLGLHARHVTSLTVKPNMLGLHCSLQVSESTANQKRVSEVLNTGFAKSLGPLRWHHKGSSEVLRLENKMFFRWVERSGRVRSAVHFYEPLLSFTPHPPFSRLSSGGNGSCFLKHLWKKWTHPWQTHRDKPRAEATS